jgi:hypothetical protein
MRPKLVGVTQLLRLLAGAMQDPSYGVVRNPANPTGPWQLSESRCQSELKELASAPCDRMAIHAITSGRWRDPSCHSPDPRVFPRAFTPPRDRLKLSNRCFSSTLRVMSCRFVLNGINHSRTRMSLWYRYQDPLLGGHIAGFPERGASTNLCNRPATKRCRHLFAGASCLGWITRDLSKAAVDCVIAPAPRAISSVREISANRHRPAS